ncbi:unnamed protein product [Adineta ricciae]|uniref:NACHT domain-containing protein n=1 Tax=Adineta ricciae TaxID=249248 RepID=A0A813YUP8_ADIRI|nr:unnamed protein product [Adineta ricciae]CAF1433419.1 unnamed protein product [Adineta ricciae]
MESNGESERVVLNGGKHVMLSYNWNSQTIVSQIYQILKDESIPIWFDIQGDMKQNIYDSMADGIENAAVVCCFLTPDYQKSENCKLELQYAKKRGKRIIPCMLGDKSWKPSSWLGLITAGDQYINFRDQSSENIHSKTKQLIDRIKEQCSIVQTVDEPSYLFELIKLNYKRNNRIEQIMNPAQSFSIEQSYINLAIVEIKEQQETEKKLRNAQYNDTIIGTFEQIYGTKTVVDISNIFNKCKDQTKNVLVLGRAGIGKSIFCQYIAYKWATGEIWSQYDLLILFPLRSLNESRYPPLSPGINYSLIDLVKKEYFGDELSENDDKLLKEQFNRSKILWILDGYDEIVQNVPEHLRYLFEQLLKTPHHIITSRPYLNTLSYAVQLEITGFTDDNIVEYVKQFFDQTSTSEKLLSFLKLNPSIWGIAHIPISLELICSVWSDTDWSETKTLTITALYDYITEWLCRRFLTKQNTDIQMSKDDVYIDCQKELIFLETLAFRGMENNTIILRKELLQKVLKETEYSSKNYARLLNIGILKSINDKSFGNQIEVQKDHYFIHLSFQEHFAARYLTNALNGPKRQIAIDFINTHKYNQRFQLVFTFTSGLLLQSDHQPSIDTFWNTILGEPLDLVGLRHTQLIMSCMEETSVSSNSNLGQHTEIMYLIADAMIIATSMKHITIYDHLLQSMQRSISLVNDPIIQDTLIKLLENGEPYTTKSVLSLIAQLSLSNPSTQLIQVLLLHFDDPEWHTRQIVCDAFEKMGSKAATDEVIYKLTSALHDTNATVRANACGALGKIGKDTATDSVTSRLVAALADDNEYVRRRACEALGDIGAKAAINDVMHRLLGVLEDKSGDVRWRACEALGKMGEKAAIDTVLNRLIIALGDLNVDVRKKAREALEKMGEKATNKIILNRLLTALGDADTNIRRSACIALGEMNEKIGTNDVIYRLLSALHDESADVRENACKALGQMHENTAIDDVISGLVIALRDENNNVRWSACQVLRRMGEKVPINEIIDGLVSVLRHEDWSVRQNACKALGEIGEKAATDTVITGLVAAIGDEYGNVQETACQVLGDMGEKVATDEVINTLIIALGNTWSNVRENAWESLRKMGEKVVINDLINRLLVALGDEKYNVRSTACRALGQISKTVATNDVIQGILNASMDENPYVRRTACETLGQMGEQAATNDVMNRLICLLKDENIDNRCRACEAFGQMGEKAVTNDVLNGLVTAITDENWNVSMSACIALEKMGEKAATDTVISALVGALGNQMSHTRRKACEALGKFGEKVLTDEIINGLVTALWDKNTGVRESACQVFERIGDKVATDGVISGLLNARRGVFGCSAANEALEKIFLSFSMLTQLSADTISKLAENMKQGYLENLRTVPPDQFLKVFLHTKNTMWLSVVTISALLQGNAVTTTNNTIMIYGRQEPIRITVSDEILLKELINAFNQQKEELQLPLKLPMKSRAVSAVCVLM